MTLFEIHDDKEMLFRGSPLEVMRIWNVLSLFKKNELKEFEKTKHLMPFNSWEGNIKIVSVIEEFNYRPGTHTLG